MFRTFFVSIRWSSKGGRWQQIQTNAVETLRMSIFNDPGSSAHSHLCDITWLHSSPTRSLPLQQSVAYYEQQLQREVLIKRRCLRGGSKNMHYISATWQILLLILIPAKYLKDVLYYTYQKEQPTEDESHRGTQAHFLSTDLTLTRVKTQI